MDIKIILGTCIALVFLIFMFSLWSTSPEFHAKIRYVLTGKPTIIVTEYDCTDLCEETVKTRLKGFPITYNCTIVPINETFSEFKIYKNGEIWSEPRYFIQGDKINGFIKIEVENDN